MGKIMAEREKHAEAQELLQKFSKDEDNNSTLVQNFLNDGLNIKEVSLCYFRKKQNIIFQE